MKCHMLGMLFALGLLAATSGCESGWKMGEICATDLQVTRYRVDMKNRHAEQFLKIDLYTGQVSFTDTDGRAYPSQLGLAETERLRELVEGRRWLTNHRGASKDVGSMMHYEAKVLHGNRASGGRANWVVPLAQTPPQPIPLLIQTFDRANRLAHPLGDQFDLIR